MLKTGAALTFIAMSAAILIGANSFDRERAQWAALSAQDAATIQGLRDELAHMVQFPTVQLVEVDVCNNPMKPVKKKEHICGGVPCFPRESQFRIATEAELPPEPKIYRDVDGSRWEQTPTGWVELPPDAPR